MLETGGRGGKDDHRASASAAAAAAGTAVPPPPRPSAPPFSAASASAAARDLSEFVAGNSNWYANPLDVWSRAASSNSAGGGGKSVQFAAAGTEQYTENVRFDDLDGKSTKINSTESPLNKVSTKAVIIP